MEDDPTNPSEWRESLRRISASLQALVRNRIELFAVEWQEEKLRLLRLLVWFGVALAIGFTGIMLAFGLLAYWLWTAYGYVGVIGLVVVLLTGAALIIWKIRHKLHAEETPFSNTIMEFRKDGECLQHPE